jgi:hypothetical protein
VPYARGDTEHLFSYLSNPFGIPRGTINRFDNGDAAAAIAQRSAVLFHGANKVLKHGLMPAHVTHDWR